MNDERRRIAVTIACAALLAAACGKREGGSCKGAESACVDKAAALACHDGKLVKVSCSGPAGCANYGEHASCDTSVANAGDPCMGEDDEYACSPDKKRALTCKGGSFSLHLACRGKGGCAVSGHHVTCDASIAVVGDPCKTAGALACAEDKKHLLACKLGKFELHRYCRGAGGCFLDDDAPSCDETLALGGDPCRVPGQVACSVDGQAELICEGGVFTRSRACKGGCTPTNRGGRAVECN